MIWSCYITKNRNGRNAHLYTEHSDVHVEHQRPVKWGIQYMPPCMRWASENLRSIRSTRSHPCCWCKVRTLDVLPLVLRRGKRRTSRVEDTAVGVWSGTPIGTKSSAYEIGAFWFHRHHDHRLRWKEFPPVGWWIESAHLSLAPDYCVSSIFWMIFLASSPLDALPSPITVTSATQTYRFIQFWLPRQRYRIPPLSPKTWARGVAVVTAQCSKNFRAEWAVVPFHESISADCHQ